MEFRHLRYFLAVADQLHFTKAAEGLHVSQPALSAQVKQLEEEVGVPLFDRVGRSVHLTRAGAIFRDHARRALREMDLARTAIAEEEGLQRGALTVGVVQTVNAYLIPAIVARFSSRYPLVSLKLDELSGPDIERGVEEGTLDVGIGFVPVASERVVSQPLFEEDFVLITAPRHPLAKCRQLTLSALNHESLILLPALFCTRRLLDAGFEQAGIQPKVIVEMNSIEGILATVRTSRLATLLPRLSLGIGRNQALRGIPLKHPTPRRGVGLLWKKGGYRSRAVMALAEEVQAVVKQHWR
ncbi:MAG: HTH-type transcriptional regulator CynR [Nitrospirae bacterium]|nr:MAG: LysR family transcriptional regulator [Nitrospira sp. OLB3]MBV6470590.1 HTH-type transcriptional regulator CynR [Nitrospirota bacterium]MCE7965407.1 transcriptional regulator CynR [Nitrospira sp. NTP2]MCK6493034.1 transcriptional regulator CynR [Nitrospira sp.]MEB2338381.1 transcriptional regulator CynR [Nitrospirales bacterium]